MRVSEEEATAFTSRCLAAAGATAEAAQDMAHLLIAADMVAQRLNKKIMVQFYVNDLQKGFADPTGTPEIIKETPGTAWVHGHNALGATVGHFCMDLAIKKAKQVGIGFVTVKGSSHYGMAGYWAEKAEKEGMIGISMTNTSPVVVPTRSKDYSLGTNPIAFAAPSKDGDRFLIDMATSAVALGKVEMKKRKNESMPLGWALDVEGQPTTNPAEGLKSHKLLPLGGLEETSGYKGYGLSMAAEILCGILSGANYAHTVPQWSMEGCDRAQNLGHCFLALDISVFAPGFHDRMDDMLQHVRGLSRIDPGQEILIPGDRRRRTEHSLRERGYIEYGDDQVNSCRKIADRLGVQHMKSFASI